MTSVLRRKDERHRGKGHVKMEAETGAMGLQRTPRITRRKDKEGSTREPRPLFDFGLLPSTTMKE
jgi:hypothetical protein